MLRGMGRIYGPVLGPFESYLTMRGIKTFPLRMERQCRNACRVATWLASHPKVESVYYPGDPKHPDAEAIARLLPKDLFGAMVSFDLKDAGKPEVFACMDRLKMIVRGTSLGDVHTLALYPVDQFAPRHPAEAAGATGHPRQPDPSLDRHRSGRRHHRRPGTGNRLTPEERIQLVDLAFGV